MAPPKLYMVDYSPTVRAVLLTAKALGVTLQRKEILYSQPEQFAAIFLNQISTKSIPTLVDNGYIIWNSHAIIAYLVGKYARDDSLYPRDPVQRSIVDERLHFETDIIFTNIGYIVEPMITCGIKTISNDNVDNLLEAYHCLEEFLQDHPWIAGDKLTIADFSLVSSVTSADILVSIDKIKYPKINAWIKRFQSLPFYQEANQVGLDNFKKLIKQLQM